MLRKAKRQQLDKLAHLTVLEVQEMLKLNTCNVTHDY